jgi:DNA-binding PadR family transcriptional regulator
VESAALLQALHRLEARQLVAAAWDTTENNRRARYYTLTAQGRTALRDQIIQLRNSVAALSALLSSR